MYIHDIISQPCIYIEKKWIRISFQAQDKNLRDAPARLTENFKPTLRNSNE